MLYKFVQDINEIFKCTLYSIYTAIIHVLKNMQLYSFLNFKKNETSLSGLLEVFNVVLLISHERKRKMNKP